MNFSHFINNIANLKKEKLLATDAHIKMAPLERITYLKDKSYTEKKPRNAAVLMLVYPKDDLAHLALIVRNTYPGVHSSQISFPGGKEELEDETLEITALRETEEEVGIAMNKIEVIRQCSEIYIPPSNFLVTPYLGFSTENLEFIPNPDEVKRVLEFPIHQLLNDDIIVQTKMTTSYATNIDVPAFQVEKYVVWGATAMMLSELKELFKNAVK
ncbi:NUDIX hydrolase [Flavobacterium terrigena]|uniref:NUDIX domain-containing protein n=1 Tax=Flavobacterium terrigena TaxID=402734 RepID=A0A1H6XX71_9FLAO|nr:CoA pyrophosphatase [Flavobacterium terrigena]SEJ33649.1 NUDIX domain-containing protein [Flavobacterium terrigena]